MNRYARNTIIGTMISLGLLTGPSRSEAWFGLGDRTIELKQGAGTLEVQLLPDRGRALLLKQDGRHRWAFEGSTADLVGGSYSIVLRNRSAERLKVVVGVDGLNVYRKKRIVGRSTTDTGSILSPGETRTLRGWQMDQRNAQRFVFSPSDWSEGQARSDSEIGLILVQVYRERPQRCFGLSDGEEESALRGNRAESLTQKAAPQPGIGTTSGDDVTSHVRTVSFDSLTNYPENWAEIDYGRNSGCPDRFPEKLLGLSLSRDRHGSRVIRVEPASIADTAGLQKGDVISRIDTEDRPTPTRIRAVVDTKDPGRYLFIRVERGRHELSLKIRM